jgi:hypothetical protein
MCHSFVRSLTSQALLFMRHNCIRDYKFPVLEAGCEDRMQAFLTEEKEDPSGI